MQIINRCYFKEPELIINRYIWEAWYYNYFVFSTSYLCAIGMDSTFGYKLSNTSKKVFPIFLAKSIIPVDDISITKLQILIKPSFVVLGYKVQRASFQKVVPNLYHNSKVRDKNLHKRFHSTYVQLSRLQTLDKIKLL